MRFLYFYSFNNAVGFSSWKNFFIYIPKWLKKSQVHENNEVASKFLPGEVCFNKIERMILQWFC